MSLELRPARRRRPVLNVTSLIDVLFLLLIFLMVSSTFVESPALQLDLPSASSAETTRLDALTITIDREGGEPLEDPSSSSVHSRIDHAAHHLAGRFAAL